MTHRILAGVLLKVLLQVLLGELHEGVGTRGTRHLEVGRRHVSERPRAVVQARQEQADALQQAPVLDARLRRLKPAEMRHLHEREHTQVSGES